MDWREARTPTFAVIYPASQEDMGKMLADLGAKSYEAEYRRLQGLYETDLALPITIRIYPNQDYYICLNALAPRLGPGVTHSHIGTREIALIGDVIAANFTGWMEGSLNAIRYEIGALFIETITRQKAPLGLLIGAGAYSQDPAQLMGSLGWTEGDPLVPGQSWRTLWEARDLVVDPRVAVEAGSIVAFLADTYGWPTFIDFLDELALSDTYSSALEKVTGAAFNTLERQWQEYYPRYLQGRWRAHVLYNYDLSAFQDMLDSGAYGEAEDGIKEAIPAIEKTGDAAKLEQAHAMLEKAMQGQEANTLFNKSRQALQRGDFQAAIDQAGKAVERFQQLGDTRKLEELAAFQAHAQEILGLRAEVEKISGDLPGGAGAWSVEGRLLTLGNRLGELGDRQGQSTVNEVLRQVNERQKSFQGLFVMAGVLVVLGLLGYRIWLVRQMPPPEARL